MSSAAVKKPLTEIYLIGNTLALKIEDMQSLPCVERAVRVSEEYRILEAIRCQARIDF
jgi:3-deoxy-7-phosphoheptulonate synthase